MQKNLIEKKIIEDLCEQFIVMRDLYIIFILALSFGMDLNIYF
jgi:hypothetical protein